MYCDIDDRTDVFKQDAYFQRCLYSAKANYPVTSKRNLGCQSESIKSLWIIKQKYLILWFRLEILVFKYTIDFHDVVEITKTSSKPFLFATRPHSDMLDWIFTFYARFSSISKMLFALTIHHGCSVALISYSGQFTCWNLLVFLLNRPRVIHSLWRLGWNRSLIDFTFSLSFWGC